MAVDKLIPLNSPNQSIGAHLQLITRERHAEIQASAMIPAHNIVASLRKNKQREYIEVVDPKKGTTIRITCSQIYDRRVWEKFLNAKAGGQVPLFLSGSVDELSERFATWLLSGGYTERYTFIRLDEDVLWIQHVCSVTAKKRIMEAKLNYERLTGEMAFADDRVRQLYISLDRLQDLLPEFGKIIWHQWDALMKHYPEAFQGMTGEQLSQIGDLFATKTLDELIARMDSKIRETLHLPIAEVKQIEGAGNE